MLYKLSLQITWIKRGEVEVANQYIWDKQTGYSLSGYDSKTSYKTLAKALAACGSSSSCKGVTKEKAGVFRSNTGSELSVKTTRTAYKKGSDIVMHKTTYFSKISGVKLGGMNMKKKYGTENKAALACIKNKKCTGVVKLGKKYYLATSWSMYTADGYTTFMKNDKKLNYISFSTLLHKYYWTVKAPYVHAKKMSASHKTKRLAMEACIANTKCKGVSYIKKTKKWHEATSTDLEIGAGEAYNKGNKGIVEGGYVWNPSAVNKKIEGNYLDGSSHSTLKEAMGVSIFFHIFRNECFET